ncbi:hemerythrin domain-containing protein [Azospirillum isscasi]|uniref:Hemerythrin domain-containing protein n=1 Tax=Azospirillum isscasi TaxID=3053926 RepID=A0ABU0WPC8_9PROT|nr:hemerythrin domain-containing protein [Azospirillum isscasi]MDQ2106046.1 hemerythrin domain-containing protein [Azospirillum isscasi]
MTTDGHTVPRTGNGFIDATHRSLMDHVDSIRRECASGASRDAMVPHFSRFADEMRVHFDQEEVIIRAAGFARWEEHANHHAMLNQQFGRLIDYVCGCEVSPDFLCTVAGTLDAALCRHEIRHDGDYAALVRAASTAPEGAVLIAWDSAFDVGVGPLDAQHRQLAELMNELDAMSRQGAPVRESLDLLGMLHDHVHAHFAMEEGVLRRVAPSRFVSHRNHHRMLEGQFARIRQQVENGRLDSGVVVRGFLRFWLMDHVLGSDRPTFAEAAGATGR